MYWFLEAEFSDKESEALLYSWKSSSIFLLRETKNYEEKGHKLYFLLKFKDLHFNFCNFIKKITDLSNVLKKIKYINLHGKIKVY